MFEILKKEILLKENKEFDENSLEIILDECGDDEKIETLMGLDADDDDEWDEILDTLLDKITGVDGGELSSGTDYAEVELIESYIK